KAIRTFVALSYCRLAWVILSIGLVQPAIGQYEDRIWLLGYDFWGTDSTFGTTMLDFMYDPVKVVYVPEQKMNIKELFAGISDSSGLLLYTNGMQIRNRNYQIVPGGDTISYGPFWQSWTLDSAQVGLPLAQGSLIIPLAENSNDYAIFHSTADYLDTFGVLPEASHIYASIVNISENSGNGVVMIKDRVVVNDTLAKGKLVACRHGNGRDWWLLSGSNESNVYYSILVRSVDSILVNSAPTGDSVRAGLGQAGFALDGNLYYRFEGLGFSDTGAYVNIYDFDRCTGLLSNHRWWTVPSYGICGAAASPNGRYLYVTTALELLQYDLLVEDIEASEMVVAEYDGYVEPGWFGTYFGM